MNKSRNKNKSRSRNKNRNRNRNRNRKSVKNNFGIIKTCSECHKVLGPVYYFCKNNHYYCSNSYICSICFKKCYSDLIKLIIDDNPYIYYLSKEEKMPQIKNLMNSPYYKNIFTNCQKQTKLERNVPNEVVRKMT